MDMNEILNTVVSGLICTAIISSITFIFNFIKDRYNKNKSLFLLKLQFFIGLVGLVCNCFALTTNSFIPKWVLIIFLFGNFFSMFLYFDDAIKYSK